MTLLAVIFLHGCEGKPRSISVSPFAIKVEDFSGKAVPGVVVVANYGVVSGAHSTRIGVVKVQYSISDDDGWARFPAWVLKDQKRVFGPSEPRLYTFKHGYYSRRLTSTSNRELTEEALRVSGIAANQEGGLIRLRACEANLQPCRLSAHMTLPFSGLKEAAQNQNEIQIYQEIKEWSEHVE
ncbi:MAG: hypothetical protein P1U64_12410 [Alcanivoracaceae bacterium]|nr:hypothetical protein [Alcanivoracaceae bacterium]